MTSLRTVGLLAAMAVAGLASVLAGVEHFLDLLILVPMLD